VVWRASAGASAQYPDPLFIGADGRDVRPERARSADAGLELKLAGGWSAQTTGFARVERGVMRIGGEPRIDAATGRRVLEAVFPEIAPTLDGDSRGADLVVSRRAQRGPTGWVAYTWALTRYRDRVTGERFAGDFDQRHTVNVVAEQRLSYRMVVHGKLRMGSNFPVTGYFGGELPALTLSALRNQVRLPRYLRLDLKVVRTFTFDRRRLTLFVEVMNATGRQNYGLADGSIRSNLDAVGYVERLIPRVPSAGILIEF
jgi:outer membrane receptor protein involved in Fe transport